ncbi:hypothetical protein [Methylophaga pinxianii]|uniref:hypothetical protein n=1 Tax=Methylophaga pinxianii TaxID=2881052 RepID=UPI001CF4C2ED|nr:hypothetical protein [Methylophaga pinxianii]MCB2425871.1 hypothetical protein [Methylophaga pinxianii]UPH45112.1 hypothetical protein LGT42_011405 [Methylophaga pinxianii]
MPNPIAYLAIIIWPILILVLIKRYGFQSGVLLGLLGAYMFLPAGFNVDLPGIPAFDKFSVTTMTLIGYMLINKKRFGYGELDGFLKVIFIGFVISPFLTALTNSERYYYLPGLTIYDGLSDTIGNYLYFIPFLIGFKYFRSYEHQQLLFKYFAIAAVIYALFALYEIRMSPSLHRSLYGFFPHSWQQQYRDGGFRAVVFMGHGLLVAFFLAVGVTVLATMKKTKTKFSRYGANGMLLTLVLVTLLLSKSLAALIFGIVALLAIYFAPNRLIHSGTVLIAAMFIAYPVLSSMKIFPHTALLEYANVVSSERAESLGYRFEHEEGLLNHANDKSLFGWGGWGRNRVRDEITGEDLSTTDGKWIITLGTSGWFGYLTQFMFIIAPIWLANKYHKTAKSKSYNEQFFLASHALIVALILVDQMPNASLNPLYWLLIGALLGRIYDLKNTTKKSEIILNTK